AALRPDLRTAINQAITGGKRVVRENLRLPVNGSTQLINVIAEPMPGGQNEPRLCVVLFQEMGFVKLDPDGRGAKSDSKQEEIIRHLEAELISSRERLQTTIEELGTVNSELNSKVESLDRALNDRKNLLESTEIATIFLDASLRIKSFTPASTDLFHLIETDLGRPITDIVSRMNYDTLARDVK